MQDNSPTSSSSYRPRDDLRKKSGAEIISKKKIRPVKSRLGPSGDFFQENYLSSCEY